MKKTYDMLEQADKVRSRATKGLKKADRLEEQACKNFNKVISYARMQQLRAEIDNKGFQNEQLEIYELIEKKQQDAFMLEDLKKYKILDERYGNCANVKKSFMDRFYENMEE